MPGTPKTAGAKNGTSKKPYLMTIVAMTLLGVMGMIAIESVRPEKDNTVMAGILFAFISPTTMALPAFIKLERSIGSTHELVNSRMTEFQEWVKHAAELRVVAAHKEGLLAGLAEGAAAADARTDQLAKQQEGA